MIAPAVTATAAPFSRTPVTPAAPAEADSSATRSATGADPPPPAPDIQMSSGGGVIAAAAARSVLRAR